MGPKRQYFHPKDKDRPIETYPGYLGYYYDENYYLEPALEPLLGFPWREYSDFEGASESSERTIEFLVRGRHRRVVFDRDMIYLAGFLDVFPVVVAKEDIGEDDWGPASGGILTFWQKSGYSLEGIADSVSSCRQALDRDFETIKKSSIAS
jgi:hypothetical protein